jgi:hypothetical protein
MFYNNPTYVHTSISIFIDHEIMCILRNIKIDNNHKINKNIGLI